MRRIERSLETIDTSLIGKTMTFEEYTEKSANLQDRGYRFLTSIGTVMYFQLISPPEDVQNHD